MVAIIAADRVDQYFAHCFAVRCDSPRAISCPNSAIASAFSMFLNRSSLLVLAVVASIA
jgi:hypothetical protein